MIENIEDMISDVIILSLNVQGLSKIKTYGTN